MNFPKRPCPLVIALLSITIAARISVSADPTNNRHDPPFWQFVLRELVFKKISSFQYQDDDLYEKLLNAPFYGGSLPDESNDINAVVSRGKVYNVPNGQWIFCQDDCLKCEPCDWQKDDPVVKWTLRRVKRLRSLGLPKWDLRLTVVPQMDESFHISKHPRRQNGVYVMHQDTAGAESSHKLVQSTTEQAVSFENINEANFWGSNGAELYSGSEWLNEETHDYYPRRSVQTEMHGSLRRPPVTYFDVDQDINNAETTADRSQDDAIPRLIVGIDQHGKKHLVHLVPVDAPFNAPHQSKNYATRYRTSYSQGNAARISRTIQRETDQPSYEKLIVKILESFNTHRNLIEKFLFADRIESVDPNEGSSHSSYTENADEKLERRSLENFRFDDSRQFNQYPSGSEYQEAEQGEQLRRYPFMTREVNKPYGEYQDENSMMKYDAYGLSVQDQQQLHQDERSLPLADVHRTRENSFAKLMDSTFGHEAFSQNRNQTDTSDIEFSMKRDFLQNSANQALVNLAVKSNQTDARFRKLPEADFEMQTFNSDD